MSRQTAVLTDTAFSRRVIDLKQAALLFDEVVILKTEEARFDPVTRSRVPEQLLGREADWLLEHGIVRLENDSLDVGLATTNSTYATHRQQVKTGICTLILSTAEQVEPWVRCAANGSARAYSVLIEEEQGTPCIPILFGTRYDRHTR